MAGKMFSKNLWCWGVAVLSLFMVFKTAYAQEKSNYALVIGIENYKNWSPQPKAISDAMLVGNELEKMGFDVTYRSNQDLVGIEAEIKQFFYDEKVNENSSLFLWYSGQGYNVGEEAFLVPADAPGKNAPGFKLKLFPVRRFNEYLRSTKAKHVFLVFDACFSKMEFMIEGIDSTGESITERQKYPACQYLCSCSTDRQKKEDVTFGEMFARTLQNKNKADVNGDGYLTVGEIAAKMQETETNKRALRYGKIKNFEQGRFVFLLSGQARREYKGDPLKARGEGPQMIVIPDGSFMMGDLQGTGFRDEKPVHVVSIPSIAVSRFEITFAEYDRFCEAKNPKNDPQKEPVKPSDNGWGRGNRPVINVSWEDAVAYTQWLCEQTGFKYRLPTEAEWEYFARAGKDTDYWWGNEIGQGKACCDGCGAQWGWDSTEKTTAPVGKFGPNPFGIYDTVGNVWEWTCSEYSPNYNDSKKEEICLGIINMSGKLVVLRGGAWNEKPEHCRVSRRKTVNLGERSRYIGFRVVKELK